MLYDEYVNIMRYIAWESADEVLKKDIRDIPVKIVTEAGSNEGCSKKC